MGQMGFFLHLYGVGLIATGGIDEIEAGYFLCDGHCELLAPKEGSPEFGLTEYESVHLLFRTISFLRQVKLHLSVKPGSNCKLRFIESM